MFSLKNLRKDESGITALETAIILIAFIVVASVFAFTILSAGTTSTERGQEAIYAGLEGVQSSMEVKGAVIADGSDDTVDDVKFTVALANGGDPVDLGVDGAVVIGYRDAAQVSQDIAYTLTWYGASDGDDMLEDGEQAEITVALDGLDPALGPNTEFTIEVKPPTGAVLNIERTTPAAIEAVMELR